MKKFVSRTPVLAVALGVASLTFGQEGSWTGWVTDTHCGARGAVASHAECAAKCVKDKAEKWALYTPADKGVWELSDQEGAAKMAGKEVTVKGKMDAAKKMITVTSMMEAPVDRTGGHASEPKPAPIPQRTPEPPDTTPLEGTGPLVDRVAALVDRAEAAEAGRQRLDLAPDQLARQLAKAATQLRAYLDTQPNDVRALILSARLARYSGSAKPLVVGPGDSVPTFTTFAQDYAPQHAALDRALTLEPNNAEAHYWKGRLYGLGFSWKQTLYGFNEPPDSEVPLFKAYADSAVRLGRRAVELAPARADYRDSLAVYLVLNEQEDEAMTLMRDVAGGRHPIYLLLTDWKAIPLPAGAVLMRGMSETFGQMVREGGGTQDYPFLRMRAYLLSMPMDGVQAFYRGRWLGFRFHKMEGEDADLSDPATGARVRSYAQYVRWRNGRVIVARDKAQIPDKPTGATEGVTFMLMEVTNPPPETRELLPIPVGNVYCVLTFINARRVEGR